MTKLLVGAPKTKKVVLYIIYIYFNIILRRVNPNATVFPERNPAAAGGSMDSATLLLAKKYLKCISFTRRNMRFSFHLLLFARR